MQFSNNLDDEAEFMATEIERKFLLNDDSWRAQVEKGSRFVQGYLTDEHNNASVRVRIEGDTAALNIKGAVPGIKRLEFDYPIPVIEAQQLLEELCQKPLIEKMRYYVRVGCHIWEIDVFEGDNQGLVVAEVELGSEDEDFMRPGWLGKEVSHEHRYYNHYLSRHPYCSWQD
jgi:adenylate cyclase